MIDMVKKKRAKKTVRADEVGVFNPLSSDALGCLAMFAGKFIESCFNSESKLGFTSRTTVDLSVVLAFMACVLKDIRMERPRYTEKDNLRLLFLTKWFLEFFLLVREQQEKDCKQRALFADRQGMRSRMLYSVILTSGEEMWPFGYVSEVVEHGWAPWVLRRMRAAVEEKV